jgi:hypothetical protein
MLTHKLYYSIKPLIPRSLQIHLRRRVVCWKRESYRHIWPIDIAAGRIPEGWVGWPGQKQFALVLHHDVDTFKGHEKCQDLVQLEVKMGFRSSFNFVPERYPVSSDLRRSLVEKGFEVGVHGLKHDGKLFLSRKGFQKQAIRIKHYLKEWQSSGFVSPSMQKNLDWICELGIEHDTSTFDTDPFEPQPNGIRTIFPFWFESNSNHKGFVELPYTLPQDFTLFVLMKERNIDIWKKKLDWIAEKGGMALLITHPNYMNYEKGKCGIEEYPMKFYEELLDYIKSKYEGQYWHALPKEIAHFWKEKMVIPQSSKSMK